MGGGRCIFRSCPVTSKRNPTMHFFKLPVPDSQRVMVWLKNSQKLELLKLTPEQQANRVVCARHFRYECFMNYKMDRLIPQQTPTLIRIRKDLAIDLENIGDNGEPALVELPPPVLPHLIPPKGFNCPLGFDKEPSPLPLQSDINVVHTVTTRERSCNSYGRIEPEKNPAREIKVYTRTYKRKMPAAKSIQPAKQVIKIETVSVPVNDLHHAEHPLVGSESDEAHTTFKRSTTAIDNTEPIVISDVEEPTQLQPQATLLQKSLELLQQDHNALKESFESLTARYILLQQSNIELKAMCNATSTTKTMPPQLTKPQLFNGVKKYLGPTMTALLRMEMFGGAERAWKPDEKQFAMELLQLGDNIYKHCSDEWRFRLPAMGEIRSWLSDKNAIADDVNQDI
ncbi:uncharacterized protein LOC115632197 [Scaptodrosophila lebanonensis]|uniref:Uncharacterized protein LOC115632197 n=1 Tax=Drosophila lebanonensis TaxID=7225 RepID=A0A6J2UCD1_DROLE|nr:uncharacterized protein LOC115632197 [Scaptodrosophila lebanonensis]